MYERTRPKGRVSEGIKSIINKDKRLNEMKEHWVFLSLSKEEKHEAIIVNERIVSERLNSWYYERSE